MSEVREWQVEERRRESEHWVPHIIRAETPERALINFSPCADDDTMEAVVMGWVDGKGWSVVARHVFRGQ